MALGRGWKAGMMELGMGMRMGLALGMGGSMGPVDRTTQTFISLMDSDE